MVSNDETENFMTIPPESKKQKDQPDESKPEPKLLKEESKPK
jgi:hypothetical protein